MITLYLELTTQTVDDYIKMKLTHTGYNGLTGLFISISRLFQMHSNKQNPKEEIGCGDIGAGVGFKDIRTGDTLCAEGWEDKRRQSQADTERPCS